MKKVALVIFLSLLFCGCRTCSSGYAEEGGPVKKKIVMIIAQDQFRDEEFFIPKDIFVKRGVYVSVASTTTGSVKGMLGGEAVPDTLIDNVSPIDFDAVLFVGGMGASQYWNDPVAHQLINQANNSNRIVAAICVAPVTLARAGILKGKRATVYSSESNELIAAGANYTGREVERDGNIITASGPQAAREFAQAVIDALNI